MRTASARCSCSAPVSRRCSTRRTRRRSARRSSHRGRERWSTTRRGRRRARRSCRSCRSSWRRGTGTAAAPPGACVAAYSVIMARRGRRRRPARSHRRSAGPRWSDPPRRGRRAARVVADGGVGARSTRMVISSPSARRAVIVRCVVNCSDNVSEVAVEHQPAVVDDDDSLAQRLHVGHVVAGEDDASRRGGCCSRRRTMRMRRCMVMSRPIVGSSRNSTCGRCSNAPAISIFIRSPSDRLRTGLVTRSPMSSNSISSSRIAMNSERGMR